MSIRTKTKRRVAVLLGVVVVLCGTVGGLYVYLQQQKHQKMQANRENGLAAAEEGDYVRALENLSKYVRKNKDDAEALYQYGVARREVEKRRNSHLAEALSIFQTLLDRHPGHKEGRRDLLKLYTKVGYETEARDLANRVLEEEPDNAVALRAKAVALSRLQQFDGALEAARRLVEAEPDTLRHRLLHLTLMQRADRSNEQILDHVQKLHEQSPDDPRFQMMVGYAHGLAGNREKAFEWLEKAASHDIEDTEFIRLLVSQLDRLGRYESAMALLTEHAAQDATPDLWRMLVRRLFERQQYDQLLQRLKDVNPDDSEADSDLLVFKALAHVRQGQAENARPIAEGLAGRERDVTAAAWAPVLRHMVSGDDQSRNPGETVQTLREALEKTPGDPYLRDLLARAYMDLGEPRLAVEQWKRVIQQTSVWSMPYVRIAQALSESGQHREALEAAQSAARRSPSSAGAILSVANAWAGALRSGEVPAESSEQLSELLSRIQSSVPNPGRILPLFVEVVARSGDKDRAARLIESALSEEEDPPSQRTLLRLAAVSEDHGLGLADRCLALSREAHEMTPDLALAMAARTVRTDGQDAAREQLQQLIDEHGDGGLQWRLARARFLDRIGDPQAAKLWKELANNNPENLSIQRMALEADSVRGEQAFVDKVIERVKSLGGQEGLTWRVARARWLLGGDEVTEGEAAEAISLLTAVNRSAPRMPEARLLIAEAFRQIGNLDSAIDQLKTASDIRPNNASILLQLGQLYRQAGRLTELRDIVRRVSELDGLSPQRSRQAASLLASTGQIEEAINLLQPGDQAPQDPQARLMLAELRRRSGQMQRANDLYKSVIRDRPSLSAIREYANFLGEIGQHEEAMKIFASLKELDLPEGARPAMLAEYYRRRGEIDRAARHYRNAIKAVPDRQSLRSRLIGLLLENGRVEAALAANTKAIEALPDHAPFNAIEEHRQLLQRLGGRAPLQPLVASLLQGQSERRAAVEALRAIDGVEQKSEDERDTMFTRLRSLADGNPRFLALQLAVVDLCLGAGRNEQAATLASRAMDVFPTEAGPAQRAARAFAAQGRWSEALSVARRWRERSASQPLEAELFIAQAHLNLGNAQQALDQLEPYRSTALENPGRYNRLVRLHCQALVLDDRADRAAEILQPLLTQAAGWRQFFSSLAMNQVSDPQTAADWLRRVEQAMPGDAASERVNLATNWYSLGRRLNNAEHRQRGREMLREAAERPDAEASTIARYAVMMHNEDDPESAEKHYRRALEKDADMTVALNNLAVLLANDGRSLDEAEKLARRAVELGPQDPNFRDSLAEVLVARGEYEAAADQLNRAIELDPDTVRWRVNLAKTHADAGDAEAARSVLAEIDTLQTDLQQVPADVRERLEKLRRTVNEKQATAR